MVQSEMIQSLPDFISDLAATLRGSKRWVIRRVICDACRGRGLTHTTWVDLRSDEGVYEACETCQGQGWLIERKRG